MATARAVDGARIAYEVTGDGRAIVLVHGITESRRSWDPLVADLARDHQVVAVDLRGHGESERRPPYDALTMASDVIEVVRSSGITEPLLIGHSLGGVVVSLHAASAPVRAVVNVDQPLELAGFKALLEPLESTLTGDDATFQLVMRQIFEALYGPLPESERQRIGEHAHPEQDVVLGCWDVVMHASAEDVDQLVRPTLGMISAPYLAVHGSDPGDEYRTWLKSTVPTATLEVWPDHGHYPHLVDPQRFLDRVRAFEQEG